MNEQRQVWVIGHKNPDTDSVCAAIAYANLKNLTEEGEFIPKKAGSLNNETAYVLKRFNVAEPETVTDVGAQVKDIDFRRTSGVNGHYSLKKAWELMKQDNVVTLPIVGITGMLEGVIVNGDIAYSYMDVYDNYILSHAKTQYKNIIETVNGVMHTGNEHAFFVNGKVVVASKNREDLHTEIDQDDLVILGNVIERQMIALEQNPGCIIITGSDTVEPDVLAKAKKLDTVVITTKYDCFNVARLINQSMPIRYFMTKKNIVTFEPDDYIDDVKEVMSKIRHRDFPVVDEQRNYIGMISRRNLLNLQKKQLILVDHNEKSQAVEGIDQAEILEIIDHHRLGSLETIQPIYFRNQPLGCCSTIIYRMYKEKGVEVDPCMAGLLLSAILSDTLLFKSPTCTQVDKMMAEELAQIAGVDMEELALSMFEAASEFSDKSPEELFYQDFKTFNVDDIEFGVSQISAVSDKQLADLTVGIKGLLEKVLEKRNLNMVFVLLTNVLEQRSILLYAGESAEEVVERAFPNEYGQTGSNLILPVVSRKKQFVPQVIQALQEEEEN